VSDAGRGRSGKHNINSPYLWLAVEDAADIRGVWWWRLTMRSGLSIWGVSLLSWLQLGHGRSGDTKNNYRKL
jgi:hypothetical protein